MAILFDDASLEFLELGSALASAYPFTMACWFYPDDTTNIGALMGLTDNTITTGRHSIRYLGTAATDPIGIYSNANSTNSTAGTTVNTWNHACGVWASATSRTIYLNGGNSATGTTNVVIGSVNRTSIGRLSTSAATLYFSGRIAEAAFWNIDLTAAEVAALAAGVSPMMIRPANLLAYWTLYDPTYVQNIWTTGVTRNMVAFNTPSQANHPPVPTLRYGLRGRIYVPYAVSGAHVVTANQTSETDTSQDLMP